MQVKIQISVKSIDNLKIENVDKSSYENIKIETSSKIDSAITEIDIIICEMVSDLVEFSDFRINNLFSRMAYLWKVRQVILTQAILWNIPVKELESFLEMTGEKCF